MPYKLIGKIPRINTSGPITISDVLTFIYVRANVSKLGAEKYFFGTPDYDLGHVVETRTETMGLGRYPWDWIIGAYRQRNRGLFQEFGIWAKTEAEPFI